MIEDGQTKYRALVARANEYGGATDLPPGQKLLWNVIGPVQDALEAFLAEYASGRAGKNHVALKYIERMDPVVATYVAAKAVLDSICGTHSLQNAAIYVASMLEDELRFRAYSEKSAGLYYTLAKDLRKRTSNYAYQRTVIINRMNAAGTTWAAWPVKDKVLLGVKFIEWFAVAGVVEITSQRTHRKGNMKHVSLTKVTADWIADGHAQSELLSPTFLPMLVPPTPWNSPYKGGYLTSGLHKLTLVKTSNFRFLEDLSSVDMPEVYASVNRIQSVAWAINKRMLDITRTAFEAHREYKGLPAKEDDDLPPRIGFSEETKPSEMNDEQVRAFKEWKRAASRTHVANCKNRSRMLTMQKKLYVADKYANEAALYFPHNLDWRGRIYPVPLYLHPQSDDAGKALLQFAKAKPLGEQGACWLAIHIANQWGEDKVSFEDRIAWTQKHSDKIVACAEAPFDERWWEDADKPWQFLAACLEWAGYVREGVDYESALPVSVDGTCNGLQNFAAMLRDEPGGEAVNLTPSDKPQDIYQRVADNVIRRLKFDPDPVASQWLNFGVTRKVVKRPVMTLPYGASRFGFVEQIMSDTLVPAKAATFSSFPFEEDGHEAAKYLAELIWQATGEELVGARQCMDWLQHAARLAASEGLPVWWTSPYGFHVMQEYNMHETIRVKTSINNERVTLSLREATKVLDKRKQSSGIAPNFVHSCDAAHLMRTASVLWSQLDNPSFACIHDSFATHACDVELLGVCLRVAFVDQYNTDVLAKFRDELVKQLTPETAEKLEPLPQYGTLDLSQVESAPFFFA